ncbi:MAG TPA: papain-like cysteine protease family protein [Chitinophagaceae bacterium]
MTSCCDPEIIGSVPNNLSPQETDNWCWAATTKMLSSHLGISVNQCDLANHRFSRTDCCNDEPTDNTCRKTNNCNSPGWLELDFAGVTFTESATARSWEDLRCELYCSKKPMGYAYGTEGVVGHVLVIKGYITVGESQMVVLNDPWSPCDGAERLITYAEYADPAGTSTHWNTWYNINKK